MGFLFWNYHKQLHTKNITIPTKLKKPKTTHPLHQSTDQQKT